MSTRSLILVAGALSCSGCLGRTNQLSETQHIDLPPIVPGGGYRGYTGTSFTPSLDTSKQVHLLGVTATASTGEFSWASSLTGAAQPDDAVILVSKSSFAGAQGTTALDVVDKNDLRSLFPDGNSFRVYWSIAYAPTLTQAYPDGVTVTVTYSIEVD